MIRKYSSRESCRSKRRWVWIISPEQTSVAVRAIVRLMFGVVEIGREIQRMREKHIAEQNAERISPARIDRRLGAAAFRFVHDVVVHEGGEVDQFHDHREIEMARA